MKDRVHISSRVLAAHEALEPVNIQITLDRRDLGRLELIFGQDLANEGRLVQDHKSVPPLQPCHDRGASGHF